MHRAVVRTRAALLAAATVPSSWGEEGRRETSPAGLARTRVCSLRRLSRRWRSAGQRERRTASHPRMSDRCLTVRPPTVPRRGAACQSIRPLFVRELARRWGSRYDDNRTRGWVPCLNLAAIRIWPFFGTNPLGRSRTPPDIAMLILDRPVERGGQKN